MGNEVLLLLLLLFLLLLLLLLLPLVLHPCLGLELRDVFLDCISFLHFYTQTLRRPSLFRPTILILVYFFFYLHFLLV